MKLMEEINKSLKKMNPNELVIVYEQIRLIEKMKSRGQLKKPALSLEDIHKMTASSKSSWSDAVTIDREERI